MQLNNRADPEIIDQLGGIIKTIDSMQESLRQHELRPYEYCKVHQEPLIAAQYNRAKDIESKIKPYEEQSDSESEFFLNENNQEMRSARASHQSKNMRDTKGSIIS